MKKLFLIPVITSLAIALFSFKQTSPYKDGDIIFQTTGGQTALAIQMATHSKYSHCGVLFFENNEWMVYEAVQPVSKISLKAFNSRGAGAIMRLTDKTLSATDVSKLKTVFKTYEGKNYDLAFNWSDDRLYCSELVYKLYNKGLAIELCKPRKLKDFDLNNPLVKQKLNEKYNGKIPLEEPMVSPEDIYSSALLTPVK
jgi:hypothetical protein